MRLRTLEKGLKGHGCYERGNGKTAVEYCLRIRKGRGINYKKNVWKSYRETEFYKLTSKYIYNIEIYIHTYVCLYFSVCYI